MMLKNFPIFLLAILSSSILCECKNVNEARQGARHFPSGFLFGASTAAYQVEGGWDADGKTESVWDYLTHKNPCVTEDCQNGDVADDSYYQYKRDVEMMRELGLDVYRFSLSWPRILPTGFSDQINEAGVQYYNNLINEMLKYNIEPMVTLYHWDIPQNLQELGGWTNPEVVDWFSDYARVVYEQFGDRVKYWITINEGYSFCLHGYGGVLLAPQVNNTAVGQYVCSKYVLLAHANAYHIYDKEFRDSQGGVVGITNYFNWVEPDTEDDIEAADIVRSFQFGWFTHAIFSEEGDWPPVMKEIVAAQSAAQGYSRSKLPDFTPEEIELIRGSSDYFGLNHYTTVLVKSKLADNYIVPSFEHDYGFLTYQPNYWNSAASSWLKEYPSGFYNLIRHVREVYNNPPIIITENGFSNRGGLDDDDRINYYKGYISAMMDAIDEGSDVRIYSPWSLMDNFEWLKGYTERFGFYEVDYTNPERPRTPRKSAFFYKQIVRTRTLDLDYEPDTTVMTIDEGH